MKEEVLEWTYWVEVQCFDQNIPNEPAYAV